VVAGDVAGGGVAAGGGVVGDGVAGGGVVAAGLAALSRDCAGREPLPADRLPADRLPADRLPADPARADPPAEPAPGAAGRARLPMLNSAGAKASSSVTPLTLTRTVKKSAPSTAGSPIRMTEPEAPVSNCGPDSATRGRRPSPSWLRSRATSSSVNPLGFLRRGGIVVLLPRARRGLRPV
jgi:hypothetical protein